MAKPELSFAILSLLESLHARGHEAVSPGQIKKQLGESRATINRYLKQLVDDKKLVSSGRGPATKYRLPAIHARAVVETVEASDRAQAFLSPTLSPEALELRAKLSQPLGARPHVSYQRKFVDDYAPNTSSLLPQSVAEALNAEGRMTGQQPAATYARKVLEQLLIDLSWASSRLEGNRYSLLETQELFKTGLGAGEVFDPDKMMLLNHKEAIEFMVDTVPTYGLTVPVVRNIHAVLMKNLLANDQAAGAIRTTLVNITDTVYVPTQIPHLLEEMLNQIVEKARLIKNPIEAAFFLWVNLAYLQPFEDGNKRTSRLSANIPLMLYNCAPLSFLDVAPSDYAQAMLGVYELLDVRIAVEVFAWTYRRSVAKYAVVLQSMGLPDSFRTKYRELLSEGVQRVVRDAQPLATAVAQMDIPEKEKSAFETMLRNELHHLQVFNCARYRLTIGQTEAWASKGRPVN